MSLSDLIKLKNEQLSFEGELTSIVLSDEGGTITGKGDATLYGAVYLTYNLTPNPKIAGQGVMTGNASAIDDSGQLNTAILSGVFDRSGHAMKIYCVDDISDGNINLAVVQIDLRSGKIRVDWSQLDR